MKMYRYSSSGSSSSVVDGGGEEEGYDEVDLDGIVASTLRKHRRNAGRLLRATLEHVLIDHHLGVTADDAAVVLMRRDYSLDISRRWSREAPVVEAVVAGGSIASDGHAMNMMDKDSESLIDDGSEGIVDGAEWSSPLLVSSIRKQMMASSQHNPRGADSGSGSRSTNDRAKNRSHRSSYLDRSVDAKRDRSQLISGCDGDDRGGGALSCSIDYNTNGDDIHIDDDDDDDGNQSYNYDHQKRASTHCSSRSTQHPPPLPHHHRSSNGSSGINTMRRSSSSSINRLPLPIQMCSTDSMLYDSALSMSFELAPHPIAPSDEEVSPTRTMTMRRRMMINLQFCGLFQDDDSDEEEGEGEELRGGRRSSGGRLSAETMDMFRLIKVSGRIIFYCIMFYCDS